MDTHRSLDVYTENSVLWVWLNRPDIRNAFNPQMIAELTEAFRAIEPDTALRAVVLAGRGKVFCAGADLNWMQEMARYTQQQNLADALDLADMLAAIDACPVPLVARVQKAAFGGALGLIACCDSVIATADSRFAFSEVRLGISPATIAPYVFNKIGAAGTRDLFLSGEVFSADQALRCSLIHALVEESDLDAALNAKLADLLKAGPVAARRTKQLIKLLSGRVSGDLRQQTAELIAELRTSKEGQEGLGAFLAKRDPNWLSG
ncbi:enoyl-CoA hydratase/isomerase family protein [bacterium]|nr:enoyl-CoA hydratase/isomerase family protein [bacterium]